MSPRQGTAPMASKRAADGVLSARSHSRRDLVLILPCAIRALIGRMELSSWRCRQSLPATERVIGGNLDHDHLDAIGSISAARGVPHGRSTKTRAIPPFWTGNGLSAEFS
jgi:hypothetical protein